MEIVIKMGSERELVYQKHDPFSHRLRVPHERLIVDLMSDHRGPPKGSQ